MIIHTRTKIAALLALMILACDQLSKWWVLQESGVTMGHPLAVTSFFNIVLVHNKGVTFGLLSRAEHPWMVYVLIAVAAIIVFLLGRWLVRTTSTPVATGLGAIMGGAIGNVIDRVRFGAVVDFLDFFYRDYHWPAFNIADAAIVTGVGLLLLDSLVRAK